MHSLERKAGYPAAMAKSASGEGGQALIHVSLTFQGSKILLLLSLLFIFELTLNNNRNKSIQGINIQKPENL